MDRTLRGIGSLDFIHISCSTVFKQCEWQTEVIPPTLGDVEQAIFNLRRG